MNNAAPRSFRTSLLALSLLLLFSCKVKQSPEPTPTAQATPTASTAPPTPTASPTPTGTATPSGTAIPTPTPSPTPTPPDPVADFSLIDLNPNSPSFNLAVSPRDYLQTVSGWYFAHAT